MDSSNDVAVIQAYCEKLEYMERAISQMRIYSLQSSYLVKEKMASPKKP